MFCDGHFGKANQSRILLAYTPNVINRITAGGISVMCPNYYTHPVLESFKGHKWITQRRNPQEDSCFSCLDQLCLSPTQFVNCLFGNERL